MKCRGLLTHWILILVLQVTLVGKLMPREDDDVRKVMSQVFQRDAESMAGPQAFSLERGKDGMLMID